MRKRTVALAVCAAVAFAGAGHARAQGGGAPTVAPDVPVTAIDIRMSEAKNSPAVVVSPRDPDFAAMAYRVDAQAFRCGLEISGDGGRSWVAATPVPKLPQGADRCYAPEVAFDKEGRLHYLFVGLHGLGNTPMGAFLVSTDDHGRSFSAPRRLLGADVFGVRMAIDPTLGDAGRIHVVWIQANSPPGLGSFPPPPNPVMAMFSDDGGKTFSRPVQVNDRERALVVAPAIAVGADHAVHVLYYDLEDDQRDYHNLEGPVWDGTWSLVLATSNDEGRSFGPGVLVEGDVVPPERVMLIFTMPPATLAADTKGRVSVAWHDARNGDWDVFLRGSADRGASWGEVRRVNDDPRGNGRHQYLPKVSIAPGGRTDVIFYDRRNDPANIRNEVFYTWAAAGGDAFSPNLRLTSESFDSRVGARYRVIVSAAGLIEFGGRLGLFSTDDRALAAWTDTRLLPISAEDKPDVAPDAVDQDVYATEVRFGPKPASTASDSSPLPAVGGALAGLALLAGVAWVVKARSRRGPSPATER